MLSVCLCKITLYILIAVCYNIDTVKIRNTKTKEIYKMKIETLLENLPQLEGSEKQIAWAEDIRKEFVEQATAYYNWILEKGEVRAEKVLAKGKEIKYPRFYFADMHLENIVKTLRKNSLKAKMSDVEAIEENQKQENGYNTALSECGTLEEVAETALKELQKVVASADMAKTWIDSREILSFFKANSENDMNK